MKVSVLIACFNAEAFVADAVRSVLTQGYPHLQVVAVDDGSTDQTAEVLARFAPKITLLRQPNRGVAAALNAAARHADGDALAFIDADDLWLPGRLARQVDHLSSHLELDAVFGHVQNFVDVGSAEPALVDEPSVPGFMKGTMLIRRSAFDRIGPFDEQIRAADFIAWYAGATQKGFRWQMMPELVYRRRIHGHNMGRVERTRQEQDYLAVMKRLIDQKRLRGGMAREEGGQQSS